MDALSYQRECKAPGPDIHERGRRFITFIEPFDIKYTDISLASRFSLISALTNPTRGGEVPST
ncbi:MAG: hypothetical protein PHV51_03565 [Methanosarcinaceae archaeon]|nr:hypothetical protein [Methanosarcinaceae archaeon]